MKHHILEICCGSVDDVIAAERGGADRVELNCDLFHGGLTPSVGMLRTAKRHTALPIIVMIRPRNGGFCYTQIEYETALEDARQLLEAGADGLAFGFLHEDGSPDLARTAQLTQLCHDYHCQAVFHRAFDVVPRWSEAIASFIHLGITRILTSGQAPTAIQGIPQLNAMIEQAAGRIEILPGSGINPHNIEMFLDAVAVSQVHLSAHRVCQDPSLNANQAIHFGSAIDEPEGTYKVIDVQRVRHIRTLLDARS